MVKEVFFLFLQTAQHTHSSQSVVMTAVVSANTDGAASALQCRLCSFVSGLVTKNGSELTPSSLTSQHFMTFSQFYIISDRSVEVAPSRISSIHSTVWCQVFAQIKWLSLYKISMWIVNKISISSVSSHPPWVQWQADSMILPLSGQHWVTDFKKCVLSPDMWVSD